MLAFRAFFRAFLCALLGALLWVPILGGLIYA